MKLVVTKSVIRILTVLLLFAALVAWGISATPTGATLSVGPGQTRTAPPINNVTAQGGNITSVNVSASTQTTVWQGFYGKVNGSMVLEDASGNRFYAWNITNISGEIYASRSGTVVFATIFPSNNCSGDNWLTGFNYADSVNNTFVNNSNRAVQVGLVQINISTACAVFTYVNSLAQSTSFHEMILTSDPNDRTNASIGANTTVYTTIINKDATGYDGVAHDYQLLVPVNRTTGFNTYSFYAEIG